MPLRLPMLEGLLEESRLRNSCFLWLQPASARMRLLQGVPSAWLTCYVCVFRVLFRKAAVERVMDSWMRGGGHSIVEATVAVADVVDWTMVVERRSA